MNSTSARILSVLFHPVFMPFYAYLILLNSNSHISFLPFTYKLLILVCVIINTAFLPLIFLFILKKIKAVSSIELSNKRERLIPLLINTLPFMLTIVFFAKLRLPLIFLNVLRVGIYLLIFSAVISYWWKISLHSMGIGALVGFIFNAIELGYLSTPMLLISSIIVAGFLGSARLQQNEHTPIQVYLGFLLGISIMILVL